MEKDLLELIDRLIARSGAMAVQWEDASTLSGGERFRLNFGDVVVEVLDGETTLWKEDGEEYQMPSYRVQVLNNRGFIVAEQELSLGAPLYAKLAGLFDVARASARNRRQVLSNLLDRIGR